MKSINEDSIPYKMYPSDNMVDWYNTIHYGTYKPLKWQIPCFEILNYAEAGYLSRLMLDAPPQHGKTELFVNTFLSYYMVNHCNDKVIACAYSASRAVKYGTWIRDIIREFKDQTLFKPKLKQDFQKKDNFMFDNPYTGELLAAGAHGPIMGNPANLILIDDIIKELKEAQSPTMQSDLREWYYTSIDTRLRKRYRKHEKALPPLLLVIAQRLDKLDLQGIIMEEEPYIDGKEALTRLRNGEKIPDDVWVKMSFPALSFGEQEDILNRPEGTPLWSNHRNYKDLMNIKRRLGSYRFNLVYQGVPSEREGTYFHREWFYNDDGTLNCTVPYNLVPTLPRKVRSYDLAAVSKKKNVKGADEVSGALTSKDPLNQVLYVYDIVNGKFTGNTLLNVLHRTIKADGRSVVTNIEQEGASQSVLFIEQLRELMKYYKIVSHKPIGSKVYRSLELQALAETGRLKFVVTDNHSMKWIEKAITQLINFDGEESTKKKHDDIVDSLSASANYWLVETRKPTL